jgi:seryl-tRNA synthetase
MVELSGVRKNQLSSIMPSLFAGGEKGVYARTELFEKVIEGLSAFVSRYQPSGAEVLRFPPVMSRRQLEIAGYLQSFPHLLGVVSCLSGDESRIRNVVERPEWVKEISATELVLAPAACYPVYPLAAARGPLNNDVVLFDVASYCFRREVTEEIDRLQAFQMREFVCMGIAEQVLDFRMEWMTRAEELAKLLELPYRIAPASDPFFGRGGRLAALSQLEQALKFELLIPVRPDGEPTACMSFNYHLDHFGSVWHLRTALGDIAHTACVAFGMDRLFLALFANHGNKLEKWPPGVCENLFN